jgi:hypothetical protein
MMISMIVPPRGHKAYGARPAPSLGSRREQTDGLSGGML